jgi:hypothetical protein
MVEVTLSEPLNMGWCLDCHRAPEKHLRPASEVTTMGYVEEQHKLFVAQNPEKASSFTVDDMRAHLTETVGKKLKDEKGVKPPQHCSGCHR